MSYLRLLLLALLLVSATATSFAQQAPDSTNRGVRDATMSAPKVTSGAFGTGSGSFSGGFGSVSAESSLGATIGGAKDIGYARMQIEAGNVPTSVDFSPEGLFSEHDIPSPSTSCDSKLCLSLGYGIAPTADDSSNALLVHLGLSTNVSVKDFKRPALQLVVVIDKSGSMSGRKIQAMKTALKKLLTNLRSDDELTLVQFDDVASVLLTTTRMGSDNARIVSAIDTLRADNGTNIEAGLKLGYKTLADQPLHAGSMKRLILFTDERPNINRTDSASFVQLITANSKDNDIGFTLFGIGFDFGQQLAYKTSQVRGANFFFLQDNDKIAKVFDEEFDFLVTPIVYDLRVNIATPAGLRLKAVYGLPTWQPGEQSAHLEIPTVFFSSNRGAIILRYERDSTAPIAINPGAPIAIGSMSYAETDGSVKSSVTELRHTGAERLMPGTTFYTHDGMRMVAALTNVYFGMRDGCKLAAEGKRKEALDAISRAKTLAMLENLSLADGGITTEIDLLTKLSANIEKGNGGLSTR